MGLISVRQKQRFHIVPLGTHDLCLWGRAKLPCLPAGLTWFSDSPWESVSTQMPAVRHSNKTQLTPTELSHKKFT